MELTSHEKINLIKNTVSIFDVVNKYGIEITDKNKIICPFHRDTNPSMRLFEKENQAHCFACGAHYDVWDFVKHINHTDSSQTFDIFEFQFGVPLHPDIPEESLKAKEKFLEKTKLQKPLINEDTYYKKPKEDYLAYMRWYITKCKNNVKMSDYFYKRGLNEETISYFRLGYDEKKQVVTIPYNKKQSYFQTRSTIKKKFWKPPTDLAGTEPLFNESVLDINEPVFVVESPICAMSIKQCGGFALALCGVGNYKKVIRHLKNNIENKNKLILTLDNDEAGNEATMKLVQELKSIKYPYIIANIAGDCKDPNELLMKNSKALESNIKRILGGIANGIL